ncbi:MAG: Gfo/Idh/MocA family oxidoreductase, partial [Acidimicrobiia bacterium]|nr:Gfo/Idh/MocA family oxidoreductase [Acidimicrobiia bacterium]
MGRWGLVGTGRMASALHSTILAMPDGEVVAVTSTSRRRAETFASLHQIEGVYSSVEAMARDRAVEFVYIASTNDRHHDDTITCLDANRPVLVEKPFSMNRRQAEAMVQRARMRQTFLMEAMWMRFQPAILRLIELIEIETIGPIRHLSANFVIVVPDDPERRWFSAALGGGSVYDLGVYPLALAQMLLGRPEQVASLSVLGPTDVETQSGINLRYPNGALA